MNMGVKGKGDEERQIRSEIGAYEVMRGTISYHHEASIYGIDAPTRCRCIRTQTLRIAKRQIVYTVHECKGGSREMMMMLYIAY